MAQLFVHRISPSQQIGYSVTVSDYVYSVLAHRVHIATA